MNKIIGIILLVAGVVFAGWGYNISRSFSGKLSRALEGAPPQKAVIFYAIGAVAGAIGVYRILRSK